MTVDSLRLPTFQEFEIKLPPTLPEQTAIAAVLSDMDAELEAIEGKPRMPVIAVTAAVFEENRAACREAGMDDFIEKPVKLETLRKTVARHMGKADSPMET